MRRLGTLGIQAAGRLTAALADSGIRAELRPDPAGGLGIWVLDEDRLAAARGVWADFEANPGAERFRAVKTSPAPADPPASPRQPSQAESPDGGRPIWHRLPVTLGLIAISVAVGAMTRLDEKPTRFGSDLSIAPYQGAGDDATWVPENGLAAIRSGQVWRLVTPIFLHFGPWHLLFNMMWVWTLAGPLELRRGPLRLLATVVVTAVASNLAEYWLDFGFDFSRQRWFESDVGVDPNPFFGGMSGVVFGLFGLTWMRARLLPSSGLAMPRDMVVWMLMWLLVCTAGFAGPIANVAHGVGLLTGMAIGAAPRLWRRT